MRRRRGRSRREAERGDGAERRGRRGWRGDWAERRGWRRWRCGRVQLARADERRGAVDRAGERRRAARARGGWRGRRELIGGEARGAIAGYVAEQTVAAGQTESVFVRAPGARTVTVRVFRMGWYGGTGGRLVLSSARLAAREQPPCARTARGRG